MLTAFRNLFRNKGFSFINIFGLSLSMSVCMLIIVIIQDQYSYDTQHTRADRIYRVQSIDNMSNSSLNRFGSTAFPLAQELSDNYPFIEDVAFIRNSFGGDAVFGSSRFELSGLYVNSSFFRVFDFELINPISEDIFDEPFKMVLREEVAEKFFGDKDPLGQFLEVDSIGTFEIVGIVKKTGKKSHIQFQALVSSPTLNALETAGKVKNLIGNWNKYYSNYAYILIKEKTNLDDVQKALDKISLEKYADEEKFNVSFFLQPLNKVVPGPLLSNELGVFLPRVFLIFLGGLAVVIIISAAFNYTSLSLARAMLRAKEVGVRKTIGASRQQIILQFLVEAILISVVALVFAWALLQVLLPAFSGMQMMSLLEIRPEQNFRVIVWFLIFALSTGIISGLIPSLFVSAFNPINVLKGVTNLRLFKRLTLRKILLVTQYVFSIVFIISIILIFRQMNYMVNAEMGFDRDVVYNIRLNGHNINRVHDQYSQLPEVSIMSAGSHVPGIGNIWDTEVRKPDEEESTSADYFSVDHNYISAMGLTLIAGQNFPDNLHTQNEKYIVINELAVKKWNLGTPGEAIGSVMLLDDSVQVEIIGVLEDYKYVALFLPMKPLVLRIKPDNYRIAVLRISSANMLATINKIEKEWDKIDPLHEIEGDFLDGQIREYYGFFEDVLYSVGFTSILAIVIASLGLYGMATYSTQTRLKEIGVRKVYGATTRDIIRIILKSYLTMVLIAALIAGPLGYLVNNLWLQYLALHVSFGLATILIGILIVITIALLTITTQTLKAANTSPAKILKYE